MPKIQSQLDCAMGTGNAQELDSDLIARNDAAILPRSIEDSSRSSKKRKSRRKTVKSMKKEVRRAEIRVGSAEDDLGELNVFLEAEMGNLMKKVALSAHAPVADL